ncbi:MAG: hypothetical protein KDK70_01675, partial [Myxococcales bacterium]|nr:hypothetical protein [Myxococcales bacterium]
GPGILGYAELPVVSGPPVTASPDGRVEYELAAALGEGSPNGTAYYGVEVEGDVARLRSLLVEAPEADDPAESRIVVRLDPEQALVGPGCR